MTKNILEGMSVKDKRLLATQLAYELAPVAVDLREFSVDELELWEAIAAARGLRKIGQPLSSHIHNDAGHRLYAEQAAFVRRWVDMSSGALLRRPARLALTELCIGCLAAHLRQRNIPDTASVILRSLDVLPYAVEQRYPGYAAARMLHKLVRYELALAE